AARRRPDDDSSFHGCHAIILRSSRDPFVAPRLSAARLRPLGGRSSRGRRRRHSALALASTRLEGEQRVETAFGAEQILERVAIEHAEERVERIAQHALQHAGRGDHASTGLSAIEARNDLKAALDLAHDVAEANLPGRYAEPKPPAFAAQRLEIPCPGEMLDDLHQVIT